MQSNRLNPRFRVGTFMGRHPGDIHQKPPTQLEEDHFLEDYVSNRYPKGKEKINLENEELPEFTLATA